MSFRDELARVIAGDSRFTIEAYAFVLESLQLARSRKLRALARKRMKSDEKRSKSAPQNPSPKDRPASKSKPARSSEAPVGHVSGQEVCEAARRLALRQFGGLAGLVLDSWGIRSTSDMGDIVYSLIASHHLEKTGRDQRSDFDNVYDFATAFQPALASIAREARANDDIPPQPES